MSNGKLIFALILFCITGPIMIGYVWPVDSTSEIAWETGDPKDISNDAINAKLPVYVPYNDPFNNNMNVFAEDIPGQYWNNINIPTLTANPGPVWYPGVGSHIYSTVHISSSGHYAINDIRTWADWTGVRAVIITKDNMNWLDTISVDNRTVAMIVYYPQSEKMYYNVFGTAEYIPSYSYAIHFQSYGDYYGTDQSLIYTRYTENNLYADISDGFSFPYQRWCDWFNGYENKGINIIFNVYANIVDRIIFNNPDGDDTQIVIWVSGDTIYLTIYAENTSYYQQPLGDISVYDKVLLTVDYDSATIALSGLRNMDSYAGDYSAAIRETITAEWRDPVTFRALRVYGESNNDSRWYVADTLSAVAVTDGSHNYEMDLRNYTASGSCQLNIRNVVQHGDSMHFRINDSYQMVEIIDGKITVDGVDGPITVPVNNMLIGLIDNKVYLNGSLWFESSSIFRVWIYFTGDWRMSIIYYPVTETSVTGYSWLPGGFGLDENGFCIVGLIVSSLTGLAASLYGRRSGVKMFAVAFVSGVIAVVYLLILMGGL